MRINIVKMRARGQIMLEAVVSLTLLTIGMLGIFGILSSSMGASRASTNQEIAVNLAAEGIEVIKSILDANYFSAGGPWNQGLNGCPPAGPGCSVQYDSALLGSRQNDFLKFDPVAGLYNYSSGSDTPFKRRITIENVAGNEMRVTSTVSWIDRNSISYSVDLEDRFFDWRE